MQEIMRRLSETSMVLWLLHGCSLSLSLSLSLFAEPLFGAYCLSKFRVAGLSIVREGLEIPMFKPLGLGGLGDRFWASGFRDFGASGVDFEFRTLRFFKGPLGSGFEFGAAGFKKFKGRPSPSPYEP